MSNCKNEFIGDFLISVGVSAGSEDNYKLKYHAYVLNMQSKSYEFVKEFYSSGEDALKAAYLLHIEKIDDTDTTKN